MNEDYALLIGSVGLFLILAASCTPPAAWIGTLSALDLPLLSILRSLWSKPSNKPRKLPAMEIGPAEGLLQRDHRAAQLTAMR